MSRAKLKRIIGGAVLLAGLLGPPASGAQLLLAEPVLGSAPEGLLIPADAAQVPVSRDTLGSDPRGSVASRSFREDGSVLVRRGLIGSWAISSGLEAGVGLFAVSGDSRKQSEFKRNWSAKDVAPKNGNIAAVGMKLNF